MRLRLGTEPHTASKTGAAMDMPKGRKRSTAKSCSEANPGRLLSHQAELRGTETAGDVDNDRETYRGLAPTDYIAPGLAPLLHQSRQPPCN